MRSGRTATESRSRPSASSWRRRSRRHRKRCRDHFTGLRDQGLIDDAGRTVHVLDAEGLQLLADGDVARGCYGVASALVVGSRCALRFFDHRVPAALADRSPTRTRRTHSRATPRRSRRLRAVDEPRRERACRRRQRPAPQAQGGRCARSRSRRRRSRSRTASRRRVRGTRRRRRRLPRRSVPAECLPAPRFGQVLDELGRVALAAKELQADEVVRAQTHRPFGAHDPSLSAKSEP